MILATLIAIASSEIVELGTDGITFEHTITKGVLTGVLSWKSTNAKDNTYIALALGSDHFECHKADVIVCSVYGGVVSATDAFVGDVENSIVKDAY